MSHQQDLSVSEWHEVARLLYEAEELVRRACRMVTGRSRTTDRALKSLWKLAEQIGAVRRGPCEERYFREHHDEQCGAFCGGGKCRHNPNGFAREEAKP